MAEEKPVIEVWFDPKGEYHPFRTRNHAPAGTGCWRAANAERPRTMFSGRYPDEAIKHFIAVQGGKRKGHQPGINELGHKTRGILMPTMLDGYEVRFRHWRWKYACAIGLGGVTMTKKTVA